MRVITWSITIHIIFSCHLPNKIQKKKKKYNLNSFSDYPLILPTTLNCASFSLGFTLPSNCCLMILPFASPFSSSKGRYCCWCLGLGLDSGLVFQSQVRVYGDHHVHGQRRLWWTNWWTTCGSLIPSVSNHGVNIIAAWCLVLVLVFFFFLTLLLFAYKYIILIYFYMLFLKIIKNNMK